MSNPAWLEIYQDSNVTHLPRTYSDHCPLLFNLIRHSNKPVSAFKFETMWLLYPDFKNLVSSCWHSNAEYTSVMASFKNNAQKWNSTCFGNIFANKRKIIARIEGLQKMNLIHKKTFHHNLETNLIFDYNNILRQEEDFWKLKSRVQ